MIDPVAGAVVLITVAAVLPLSAALHARGPGRSDFSAAARPVPLLRASATVSGELASAVAFLAAAGVVLVYGTRGFWAVSALGVGYCLLAIMVAGPLRRSGVYSPSDFAEWRLGSRKVRRLVSACVVGTGWMYLMAQFAAAGLLVRTFTDAPGWVGSAVLLVATLVIVLGGGAGGGFQAAYFWIKLLALAVPAAVMVGAWALNGPATDGDLTATPVFPAARTVEVPDDGRYLVQDSTRVRVTGEVDGRRANGVTRVLDEGVHEVSGGTELSFAAGAPVPRPQPPMGTMSGADPQEQPGGSTLSALSIHLALAFGLIGMPQFIGRISATRSPRESRWLVLSAMTLLGVFLSVPLVFGWLGRVYSADLIVFGRADELALALPSRVVPGPLGEALTAVIGVGAAIAVITVCAALCRALGGTISQCVLGGGSAMFRVGAVMAMTVPVVLLVALPGLRHIDVVTPLLPAFQLSAVTLAPLLLLGLWWRGLTYVGTAAGMSIGLAGTAASIAAGAGLLPVPPDWALVVEYPVPFLLPLVFAVMVGLSLLTRGRRPAMADAMVIRMHVDRVHPARDRRTVR